MGITQKICGNATAYMAAGIVALDFTQIELTFSKWEKVSHYVGGKYEHESVEVFFKVSVDAKGIEWTKVS